MRWGQSERTFGVVIPAKGAIAYVCPGFEEDRARELIKPAFGDEVRVWQEDESPYAGDREDRRPTAACDTAASGSRSAYGSSSPTEYAATPGCEVVDATPVTAGCRMFKSQAEIALMQRANDVTLAAYKAALSHAPRGYDPGRADPEHRRWFHPPRDSVAT